jgi:hypothetical protein
VLTPVIPATQEAEIRRIPVQSQLGKIVLKTQSRKKPITKKGWGSGSSGRAPPSPSTTQKRQREKEREREGEREKLVTVCSAAQAREQGLRELARALDAATLDGVVTSVSHVAQRLCSDRSSLRALKALEQHLLSSQGPRPPLGKCPLGGTQKSFEAGPLGTPWEMG